MPPLPLSATCVRCPTPVTETASGWRCPAHGAVVPLWRPTETTYDAFVSLLLASSGFPTYLPWPMSPGWRVSDAGAVVDRLDGSGRTRATVTCCTGTSALDGPVDVIVVAEEPGTGLGGRIAGTRTDDPGPEVGQGAPAVQVLLGHHTVRLWPVSTSETHAELDRSVFAGEAFGRWLWLVLRPASAMLLLRDDWILRDVSGVGPPLVEMPFGGPAPAW